MEDANEQAPPLVGVIRLEGRSRTAEDVTVADRLMELEVGRATGSAISARRKTWCPGPERDAPWASA